MPDREPGRPHEPQAWGVVALVVAFLLTVVVLPLGAIVVTVAQAPLAALAGLSEPEALSALGLSIVLAAVAFVVNGVVGVGGALVLVRQRFRGLRLLDALVDLPLAVTPVTTGLGFLLLFGRTGLFGPWLDALGLRVAFAFPGLVVATLFVTVPFTLREVALVLEALGTAEEEAAATLGASAWQTFLRVTLPNVRHAFVAGSTLTVARALGEFGAVLVLGGSVALHTETATTFIHGAIEERAEPEAYGMALALVAASVALLALLEGTRSREARALEGAAR